MSFRGSIETRCPNGCEPMTTEVWSFVKADADEELRESLLAGELNLLLCEHCGAAFYPEATVVYLDEGAELLAFIFPESYRGEASRWRRKMREDWRKMRRAFGPSVLSMEPLSFFGLEELRAVLRAEDEMEDEVRVAEVLCGELGLGIHPMDRSFARRSHLPRFIPLASAKSRFTKRAARGGLNTLLGANDRLAAFRRWKEFLDGSRRLPPAASKASEASAAFTRRKARSAAKTAKPRRRTA